MTFPENMLTFAGLERVKLGKRKKQTIYKLAWTAQGYDPEMLYVECQKCGRPVVWAEGKTTTILAESGIDMGQLDERCMVISDGCPVCSPKNNTGFTLSIVRVAGLTPEEAVLMNQHSGHA